MSGVSTQSYLLFSRPQGETSLWLSLLTEENGRVSLVFKGGRKHNPRSFQAYQLWWTPNRHGDGGWCRSLEAEQCQLPLKGMINWSGLYANELVHRLLPAQMRHPLVFTAYQQLMTQLHHLNQPQMVQNSASAMLTSVTETGREKTESLKLASALRQFEWQLLSALGYALALTTTDGQPLMPEYRYDWQENAGWVRQNPELKTGILGQDLLQLAQTNTFLLNDALALQQLRIFLQHRLALIMPNLPFAMRHWWEKDIR